jgi:Flp pilus assembly pilin Flp
MNISGQIHRDESGANAIEFGLIAAGISIDHGSRLDSLKRFLCSQSTIEYAVISAGISVAIMLVPILRQAAGN